MSSSRYLDAEGRIHETVDNLAKRVKRWARRKGHCLNAAGVEGIAPI